MIAAYDVPRHECKSRSISMVVLAKSEATPVNTTVSLETAIRRFIRGDCIMNGNFVKIVRS
jgi:hypothetical protein